MIKVILCRGAGNQLFQYAVGRFLSYTHGSPLRFDISWYGRDRKAYVLPRFDIAGKAITPIPSLILQKIIRRPLWQLSRSPIYCEKDHHFDSSVLSLPKSCTLSGWFQSEKYFKPISHIIRSDLSLKINAAANDTLELERRILDANSVSLHVRRGDYVGWRRYDVCTMEYYEKAMKTIRERVDDPSFYVFSDDIGWCIHHFRDPSCTFVDLRQSQEDPLHDLRLMSLCKHNIIANSSFSWWGAWLNSNPQKIVICPYVWFNASDVPIEDKMCEGWLRIVF